MTERKSPPGPREMVQEHRVINTFSGIQFVEEGEPVDQKGCDKHSRPDCEDCYIEAMMGHDG